MTKKYYDEDAYRTHFEATVLSSEPMERGYAVTLDGTLFFPEEGGQTADTGTLGSARVLDARLKDGVIYHITDAPLPVGERVVGEIDFADRYHKMQNHTGEHIVSGIVHRLYGLENVGFHLGSEDVTLDFSGELTREQLNRVEELANEAIYRNLAITARYPSAEELKSLSYRAKLDLTENVRIVTIEDVDACACCAPHVRRTGEVGLIKLLDFVRYKGGVRIHMQCGRAALLDYRARYEQTAKCSALMSVKQGEVAEGVSALLKANEELSFALKGVKKQAALMFAKAIVPSSPLSLFVKSEMDAEFWREVASSVSAEKDGVFAFFYKKNERLYAYVLCSKNIDLKPISSALNQTLTGKGGGKNGMVQGSVNASEEEIRAFFRDYAI